MSQLDCKSFFSSWKLSCTRLELHCLQTTSSSSLSHWLPGVKWPMAPYRCFGKSPSQSVKQELIGSKGPIFLHHPPDRLYREAAWCSVAVPNHLRDPRGGTYRVLSCILSMTILGKDPSSPCSQWLSKTHTIINKD